MVTSIPFPSFKNSPWVKNHKKQVLFIVFLIFIAILMNESFAIPALIIAYTIASLANALINKEKFDGIFDWKNESDIND